MSSEALLIFCIVFAWMSQAIWRQALSAKPQPAGKPILMRKLTTQPGRAIRSPCKPDWVLRDILQLKAMMPSGSGVRQIAVVFNRIQQAKPQLAGQPPQSISKSHVANVLRSHASAAMQLRMHIRQRQPGISAIQQTWGVDLTGKKDMHGQLHYILGIIDHGSRKLMALLVSSKHSAALGAQIKLTSEHAGAPKHIRTDNERCFTSPAFRLALRQLGIHHQTTELHCPWQNGRIERLFGTLKAKLD